MTVVKIGEFIGQRTTVTNYIPVLVNERIKCVRRGPRKDKLVYCWCIVKR